MKSLLRYLPLLALLALCALPMRAAAVPRSEHPMPQAQRAEWLNLNGTWEFAETDESADSVYLGSKPYPGKIVVPYCRESKLSGLARKGFVKNVWYRRTFDLPKGWRSPRTILHIGACDYATRVWVNGALVGRHKGGNAPVSCEITRNLKRGSNTVIVTAFDDTRSGLQATGKQSHELNSFGCFYTRTTGIWQTVWLEGVGSSYVTDAHVEPDPANSRILVHAEVDGPGQGLELVLTARAGGKVVGTARTPANWRDTQAVVNLSNKHLWSVKDPFLYDLDISLVKGNKIIDSVGSYFGLRSVTIQGSAILINGKPVFQRLVLDQGFYPEGIWTAPTDADLKKDIELSMAVGFNGARLHQKVFEPRFLYWADKLGYLVWGEFPNWGMDYSNRKIDLPVIDEWVEILRRDRNHPAIVGWCPFNETNGGAGDLQNTIVGITRLADPSRPVIDTSGYVHSVSNPDALDTHDYDQNPASFRNRWCKSLGNGVTIPTRYGGPDKPSLVPFMVSEYGGIGWATKDGWGYGAAPKSIEDFYTRYKGLTDALLDSRSMFGFCYTQLTNVEQEQNGIYTYDRQPKFDAKRMHAINSREAACEKTPQIPAPKATDVSWQVLVGAAPDKGVARPWRYTTDKPEEAWSDAAYDDSAWKTGPGGFGAKGGFEPVTGTPWDTSDIWLRQEFAYDGNPFDNALLVAHYDNGTEVYVNGTMLWRGEGWNDRYDGFTVTQKLKNVLKTGRNTMAIHCHQDGGGQFIDAALLVGNAR